jgi:hypothetical protein
VAWGERYGGVPRGPGGVIDRRDEISSDDTKHEPTQTKCSLLLTQNLKIENNAKTMDTHFVLTSIVSQVPVMCQHRWEKSFGFFALGA